MNNQLSFFYGASPDLIRLAAENRKNMTMAEKMLWEKLRRNQLLGLRFKAQHPISYYIADFYCHKAKLVIEVDGESHLSDGNIKYDIDREIVMKEFGISTIRFRNEDIFTKLEMVIDSIKTSLIALFPNEQFMKLNNS